MLTILLSLLLIFCFSLSPADYTRARSDEFAEKNGLPKFEYVLHPRTTGFTFIVDTLRKGQGLTFSIFTVMFDQCCCNMQ